MAIYLFTVLNKLKATFDPEGLGKKFYWFDDPSKETPDAKHVWEIEDVYFGKKTHPQGDPMTWGDDVVYKDKYNARKVADALLAKYEGKGLIEISGPVPTLAEKELSTKKLIAGFEQALLNYDIEKSRRERARLGDPIPNAFERLALDWRKSQDRQLAQSGGSAAGSVDLVEALRKQAESNTRTIELLKEMVVELGARSAAATPVFAEPVPPAAPELPQKPAGKDKDKLFNV